MHHEIRQQKASSSDPPTTGSSGDPGVTDPRSLAESVTLSRRLTKGDRHSTAFTGVRLHRAKPHAPASAATRGTPITWDADDKSAAKSPEIPLDRCCHTGPAKHHPSSGTTEKGK